MEWLWIIALQLLTTVLIFFGQAEGLRCWHCIADNCEIDPEGNYKAEKRTCQPGQLCQKVFFLMESDTTAASWTSVVRGCAEQCQDLDEFPCNHLNLTIKGCVRRNCCRDQDLCNSAHSTKSLTVAPLLWSLLAFLLAGGLFPVPVAIL